MHFYFSLGKYKMFLFPHPWYIWRYTSPNENFEYSYPHSKGFLQFPLKLKRGKPYKTAHKLLLTLCYYFALITEQSRSISFIP